ncbi:MULTISPECIES: YdaS family helix-turn-helix protein [Burkholderiaceae]|uniref:transcriptional regulator n=1 Tax=Burkholderiaceae TaxID=119060 RepID=UPI0009642FAC|nr:MULTISPECIES: YdaS family helix-turn-helix protein [Burkholderiaceae]MCG1038773.1 helix-turn-helix domain-containing protein [Mycetohabitans sp. B7]SIT69025.1 DNA-binding transcriptional regulator YdaS, prophage-encoded, Cro superfamily [Burkholderia sp. b14]
MDHFAPIKEACDTVNGLSGFARMVGVKPPTAYEWLTRQRPVPPHRCVLIEKIFPTSTRKRLRPKDWMLIWPELAEEEQLASREAA